MTQPELHPVFHSTSPTIIISSHLLRLLGLRDRSNTPDSTVEEPRFPLQSSLALPERWRRLGAIMVPALPSELDRDRGGK